MSYQTIPFRNRVAIKSDTNRFPNSVIWAAEQVFAASVAADQTNGGYCKFEETEIETGAIRKPNKVLVHQLLSANTQFEAEVIEQGQLIRQHFQGLLFDQMAGELKDFLATVLRVSTKETFASNDWLGLAVIAALPSTYRRDVARREAEAQRNQLRETSKPYGQPGDRVQAEVEIVQCNWSHKWSMWTVNATLNGNLFFFFFNKQLSVGNRVQLTGTVKLHRDDNTTQLNRVKIN
jgi:hypothetical protein